MVNPRSDHVVTFDVGLLILRENCRNIYYINYKTTRPILTQFHIYGSAQVWVSYRTRFNYH